MTDLRKAAEMALEALEDVFDLENKDVEAIQALRQALAQPEQEPVCFLRETSWSYEIAPWDDPNGIPVYTAPPKREWVGYTNEDRKRIVPMLVQSLSNHDERTMAGLLNAILIDIEQQLKEKNGG